MPTPNVGHLAYEALRDLAGTGAHIGQSGGVVRRRGSDLLAWGAYPVISDTPGLWL